MFVFWFAVSGLIVSTSGLCWDMQDPFKVLLIFHKTELRCEILILLNSKVEIGNIFQG